MSNSTISSTNTPATSTNNFPLAEDITKKWKKADVIEFLEREDLNLDLDNDDIEVIRSRKVSGGDFLRLTEEKLEKYGLQSGPITRIVELIKSIKGEEQRFQHGKVDQKMMKYWQDLKVAHINENFLYLPNTEKPCLFIRKCYYDLAEIVLANDTKLMRITGNPGIGKTFFGRYLLYRLAQLNKTVVYDEVDKYPILFSSKFVLRGDNLSNFHEYLEEKDVWYIVDGKQPKSYNTRTILICSPWKSHFTNFDKRGEVKTRYMPVWKPKEIEICRKKLFNNIEIDLVNKLFLKWGGIPQFILQNAKNDMQQSKLDEAIITCDEDIFKYIGESDSNGEANHKLIHIVTNLPEDEIDEPPYTQQTIKFASNYVSEAVANKFEAKIRERLCNEAKATLQIGQSNQVLEKLFEQMAHKILQKGGSFEVRSLDSGNKDIYNTYQQNQILTFSAVDTIENDKYYQTIKENFPSIDAIIAPTDLFQMTTSLKYSAKMTGLKELSYILSKNKIRLYFVVPLIPPYNDLFNHFQKQKFITSEENDVKWLDNIEQYVLGIELSSRYSSSSRSHNVSSDRRGKHSEASEGHDRHIEGNRHTESNRHNRHSPYYHNSGPYRDYRGESYRGRGGLYRDNRYNR